MRRPPVQDNHYWLVPRVVVLYKFYCIRVRLLGLGLKLGWKLLFPMEICKKVIIMPFIPFSKNAEITQSFQCMNIRIKSGLHFPAFGLNMERYGVLATYQLLKIQNIGIFCWLSFFFLYIYIYIFLSS